MKKSKNNNTILGFGYWVFEFGCKGKVISFEPQKIFKNWVLYEKAFFLGFEGSKVNVGLKDGNF